MTLTALDILLTGFTAGVSASFVTAVLIYLCISGADDDECDPEHEAQMQLAEKAMRQRVHDEMDRTHPFRTYEG